MAAAEFRFYEELNDFLAPRLRKRSIVCDVPPGATVKHAIEALGVPHTEVELVLVDGESVPFERRLAGGERVAVYPAFEAFDIGPLLRVRAQPLREPRFIADAHLGALARLLRFVGHDTLYRNAFGDAELVATARAGHRTVLTRDRGLLMRREVTHGLYVRATVPAEQLREVLQRLHLGPRPGAVRCLLCNTPLAPLPAQQAATRVPPAVQQEQAAFWQCVHCDKVYWRGSHWRRLQARVAAALGPRADPASRAP
jgi:hypothetical protein